MMQKLDIRDLLDEDMDLLEVAIAAIGNRALNPNGGPVCALLSRISDDLEQISKELEPQ